MTQGNLDFDAPEPPREPLPAKFNGPEYQTIIDHLRLEKQIGRVYHAMKDGLWRTLDEIHNATGDPVASVSAQLRHLRKARFGAFTVNRRARGNRDHGLFEYQLTR